jgi:hypothetical protein
VIRPFSASLSLALLLFCAPAPSAFAGDGDDATSIMADCGGSDLPASAVDACLERARVLDETDPSAELQSLEARLEERETMPATRGRTNPAAPPQPSNPGSGYEARGSDSGVSEPGEGLQPDAAEPDRESAATRDPRSGDVAGSDNPQPSDNVDSGGPSAEPDLDDDEPPVADPPDSDSPDGRSPEDPAPHPDDPR